MFWIGALVLAITWFDLGETHVASGRTLTQQFAEYPELLGSPRFWGYSMAAACCSGAFFAYLGGAPFVGSVVFGMEPAELGIYFGAPAVGYFLGNFITARKATVVGVNTLVLWGCLANAIGGSVSMMSATRPASWAAAARWMASVVFPAPPFWLMIAITGMAPSLHVDMATWQVVDMSARTQSCAQSYPSRGKAPATACSS